MAEGDGGNSGQTEAAKPAAASGADSRQTGTIPKIPKKPTPISLPDTSNSYFYNDDDRTPPKDTRGRSKSRRTMNRDKGEHDKKSKEDFILKPAPVNVSEKNQIIQYLVNEHLKNPLNKFAPEIKVQTLEPMETETGGEDHLDDTFIDDMIPKHPADTSRPTTIIEVLKISDNLLGTIATLQAHVNQLTTYTESLEETKRLDREIIKNLEARLTTLEKKQESMSQGDILTFTTMQEKAEELKRERSQIRRQTALHDRKHMAAVRRFASPSPSFQNPEGQAAPYSEMAAKNTNQQGPSNQNNTLSAKAHNQNPSKPNNPNQQMNSEIFRQQMQKNKNTQKTTGGLIVDDNMRNIKDKKKLFQELRKQINIQEKPKYVKPIYAKDEEMDKIGETLGILNVNWEDVRVWKDGNRAILVHDTPDFIAKDNSYAQA